MPFNLPIEIWYVFAGAVGLGLFVLIVLIAAYRALRGAQSGVR